MTHGTYRSGGKIHSKRTGKTKVGRAKKASGADMTGAPPQEVAAATQRKKDNPRGRIMSGSRPAPMAPSAGGGMAGAQRGLMGQATAGAARMASGSVSRPTPGARTGMAGMVQNAQANVNAQRSAVAKPRPTAAKPVSAGRVRPTRGRGPVRGGGTSGYR